MRTMVINGESSVKVSPDCIEIDMEAISRNKDYAKAVEKANANNALLRVACEKAGISADRLKTSAYRITVERENVQEKDGTTKSVQKGYLVSQNVTLEMPLDFALCGAFLSFVTESKAEPQVSLRFKVKNDTEIREKLMTEAVLRARKNALALAKISGVKLGPISEIRYNDAGAPAYSPLRMRDALPPYAVAMDLSPADVELTDSVTIVWEID